MIGVTAFRGMIPNSPGKMQSRLQVRATALPVRMVMGMRELWFDVPENSRAMCGTASPMNAMGPQKAVVAAVRMPVDKNIKLRTFRMFIPKFSA